MERSGDVPSVGVRHDDLVQAALTAGPVASVCLATPAQQEQAESRSERGWKPLRRSLLDQGAPSRVVELVDELVPEAHLHGEGLVLVASEERVVLVERLPDAPRAEWARWATLPALATVIEHRQGDVPYFVAVVDRIGADITARWRSEEETITVEGEDRPIRKVSPGGWSQRTFQMRAEDSWERNAATVADELARLAAQTRPELIVVAGDVRAATLLREHLPSDLRPIVRDAAGSRAADGSEPAAENDVRRLVHTAVAADTVALLERFREEHGQDDRATNEPAATVTALQRAQVDVLLIHDDPNDGRMVGIGPEPTQLALHREELAAMGVRDPSSARLVDAAIRAALGTGASVRVVPGAGTVEGSISAVLRWSA